MTDQERQNADTLAAYAAAGSFRKAAEILGVNRSTVQRRLTRAGLIDENGKVLASSEPLPPPDIPPIELFEHLKKRQRVLTEHAAAKHWRAIKVNENKPFAIMYFTDVHLGDDGTDYADLERHMDICRGTDGMYAAFNGDVSNNWILGGRLAQQWAMQSTSLDQEQQLTNWFLNEAGMPWLFWVLGNHDAWNNGVTTIKGMNVHLIPMEHWRAKFRIELPNGREIRIDSAHDFKGHSKYNTLHALMAEAREGEEAHLYLAGHRHSFSLGYEEFARRSTSHRPWMVRVRGFKRNDKYAFVNQFPEQESGAAAVLIINPNTARPNPIVHVTDDPEDGADYLSFLRSRT